MAPQFDVAYSSSMNAAHASMLDTTNDAAASEKSREDLRKELLNKRKSLTPQEFGFLNGLVERGSEREMALAKKKLADNTLFFEELVDRLSSSSDDESDDEDEEVLASISRFRRRVQSERPVSEEDRHIPDLSSASMTEIKKHILGSELRQELLNERRQSTLHGQIWKAHQNGLAVTAESSRKSFLRRESFIGTRQFATLKQQQLSALNASESTLNYYRHSAVQAPKKRSSIVELRKSAVWPSKRASLSGSALLTPKELEEIRQKNSRLTVPGFYASFKDTPPLASMTDNSEYADESEASCPADMSGPTLVSRRALPFSEAGVGSGRNPNQRLASKIMPQNRRSWEIASNRPAFLRSNSSRRLTTDEIQRARQRACSLDESKQRQPQCGGVISSADAAPTLLRSVTAPTVTSSSPPATPPLLQRSVTSPTLRPRSPSLLHRLSTISLGAIHEGVKDEEQDELTDELLQIPPLQQPATLIKPQTDDESLDESHVFSEVESEDPLENSESESFEALLSKDHCLRGLRLRRASVNIYEGEGMEVAPGFHHEEESESTWEEAAVEEETEQDLEAEVDDSGKAAASERSYADTRNSDSEKEEEKKEDEQDVLMPLKNPLLMRRASANIYSGEGMEISDWDAREHLEDRQKALDSLRSSPLDESGLIPGGTPQLNPIAVEEAAMNKESPWISSSSSFDETMLESPEWRVMDTEFSVQLLRRSFSDDGISGILLAVKQKPDDDNETASLSDHDDESYGSFEYDAWLDLQEGMGDGGPLPFRILGTSADDVDSHPHVLSPPLMESLQEFFPFSKTSDNFWMKYSLVRDGASMHTFMQNARGAQYSVLALETVDGEVMGAFTSQAWRRTWSYFGNGETFLWRMRHSRKTKCHSIIDQAHLESEIDVYPYTGENNCIQFCTRNKIAVGGGAPDSIEEEEAESSFKEHEYGFGLNVESDLLHGTSSPCITFGSPSLSDVHSDGSRFEIINMELWTLTPCYSLDDAEKLEMGRLFLEDHETSSNQDFNELFPNS